MQLCRFLYLNVCSRCDCIRAGAHSLHSSTDTVESCASSVNVGSYRIAGWVGTQRLKYIRLYLHTFKCKGRHFTSKRQFSVCLSSSSRTTPVDVVFGCPWNKYLMHCWKIDWKFCKNTPPPKKIQKHPRERVKRFVARSEEPLITLSSRQL